MSLDWTNAEVFKFLKLYRDEPCIWDPRHVNHKDKKMINNAWFRLSHEMDKPIRELKTKKESLMVTFRKYVRKKLICIRSGGNVEEIPKPVWYAYSFMESFLLPIYIAKMEMDPEMLLPKSAENVEVETEEIVEETVIEDSEAETVAVENTSTPTSVTATTKTGKRSAPKIGRRPTGTVELLVPHNYDQLELQPQSNSMSANYEHECDLYARLLAKKLKDLPKFERQLVMFEIDGIFVKRIRQRSGYISANRLPRVTSSYSDRSYQDPLNFGDVTKQERNSSPSPRSIKRERKKRRDRSTSTSSE